MVTFIAILFTLVFGTLAFNIVRLKFFGARQISPILSIGLMALVYFLVFNVGTFVGSFVWGATMIATRIMLILVILGLVIYGISKLYTHFTGKALFTFGRKDKPTDPNIKDAEIIEVVDYKHPEE